MRFYTLYKYCAVLGNMKEISFILKVNFLKSKNERRAFEIFAHISHKRANIRGVKVDNKIYIGYCIKNIHIRLRILQ